MGGVGIVEFASVSIKCGSDDRRQAQWRAWGLPGQGDLKTLEQFSRSIGDETRVYRAEHSDRWRSSSSEQRVGRPLVTVDELRRQRNAVLIYANAPPAQLELRRWDQVSAWRRLVDSCPAATAGSAGKGEIA